MKMIFLTVVLALAGFGVLHIIKMQTRVLTTVEVPVTGGPVPSTITLQLRPHGIVTWEH